MENRERSKNVVEEKGSMKIGTVTIKKVKKHESNVININVDDEREYGFEFRKMVRR